MLDPTDIPDVFANAATAAEMLHVCKRTVLRIVRREGLTRYRRPGRRGIVYRVRDLAAIIGTPRPDRYQRKASDE